MQIEQCDSGGIQKTTYAVKFGEKMTQEKEDAKVASYIGLGWSLLRTDGPLAFISPCREWIHSFDRENSGVCMFPVELAKKLGMYG